MATGPLEGFRPSPGQKRLWRLAQADAGAAGLTQVAVLIDGPLEAARLVASLDAVVRRHEILRTELRCPPGSDVPLQIVGDPAVVWTSPADLGGLTGDTPRLRIDARMAAARTQPADQRDATPLRASLSSPTSRQHLLILTASALCADRTSLFKLLREAALVYAGDDAGTRLPEPMQYADVAAWHEEVVASATEGDREYWRSREPAPGLEPAIPGQPDASAAAACGYRRLVCPLTAGQVDNLTALCRTRAWSVEQCLLAAWLAFMRRVTGAAEIVVRTALGFHDYAELEHALGPLTMRLPLRMAVRLDRPFDRLVEDVGRQRDEMSARREYGADSAATSRYGFEFVETPAAFEAGALSWAIVDGDSAPDGVEVGLVCVRTARELRVEFQYAPHRVSARDVERVASQYVRLLQSVVSGPADPVARLELLTDHDRHGLLVEFNRTATEFPSESCLHQLFEAQVEQTPDLPAAVCGATLTYRELNHRANQLARYLRTRGAGPDVLVPVCCSRGVDMIVGLLAVLKSGAAYVPLDPSDPEGRRRAVLQAIDAPVLLTQAAFEDRLGADGPRRLCIDRDRQLFDRFDGANVHSGVRPANLAYVIHTSGSTGVPKGVMIPHRGLVNYLHWCRSAYPVAPGGGAIVHSSFAFDLTVTSLFAPLLSGGTVVLAAEDGASAALAAALGRTGTGHSSFLKLTPGQLQLLNQALPPGEGTALPHVLVCGGEQLYGEDLRQWRSHAPAGAIVNEYGPTETVVGCCVHTVHGQPSGGAVPIGRPIANTQLYVLDGSLIPVPMGVPGQLYVGGAGVARGYLTQPALTAERFIPDPFGAPGGRLYATGDVARLRPDGELEYLGRSDDQVKIRAYRVEPGEVEAAFALCPGVRQAAVVAVDDAAGGKRLVAYYVLDAEARNLDIAAARALMAQRLPEYMVPASYVRVAAIPLTAGGKVDRRALAAADPGPVAPSGSFVPPRSLDEEVLSGIWADVLGLDYIGIDDNYFVLGGDSIRSLQIVARARKRGLNFTLDRLFSNPTVRELAASLRAGHAPVPGLVATEPFGLLSAVDRTRLPDDVEDAYPLTMLQGGMLFHRESQPETSVYHDIFSLHLQARFDLAVIRSVLERLIAGHPALRTSFDVSHYSEPLQLVHRAAAAPLGIDDLRDLPAADQDRTVAAWVRADKARGFDPASYPLVRFHVHVRSDEAFQFSGSFHHAIIDGWSDAVMVTEIFERYFSTLGGEALAPLPAASSFRDFVALERQAMASAEHQRFWDDLMLDAPTAMLPQSPSSAAAAMPARLVNQVAVPIGDDVAAGLKKAATDATVPLKSVLLAAHLRVLTTLSGSTDVVTSIVSSGRLEHVDGERVLGLFLNSVPFRMNLTGGGWSDLISAAFEAEERMLPFRRYPLGELKRRRGGRAVADTLFYFTNYHVYQNLQRFDAQLLDSSFFEESSFPLVANFRLDPFSAKLFLDLQGDQQYLSVEEMARIGGYYERALAAVAAGGERRYELTPLLSAAETATLAGWNATALAVDDPGGVHGLVAAQAARTPAAAAVVCGTTTWSYATLLAAAGEVAGYLRAAGVGPETVVGICRERDPALVAAVLGVWQAGAAYVPLDAAAPPPRVAAQVADAGARLVLTSAAVGARLGPATPGVAWVPVERARGAGPGAAVRVPGAQLAYVIYTSGSTGEPKGVGLEHRQLRNLLAWAATAYPAAERAGVLAGTALSFDLSLFELWVPLTTGGTVVLAADVLALATLPARDRVRLINTVPTALAALVAADAIPAGVRTINVAGEPLRPALVAAVLAQHPTVRVVDLYGPTETTTYVTGGARTATGPETIGRPLANTTIQVLDAHQQPVPVGVRGDVYVGGAGVARGYVGRPGLTAAAFVPDPWSATPGGRLYRTGDLGWWRADGQLVCAGRRDGQVKLRGYRIELGEIEAALAAVPGVAGAVAVVRTRGAAGPQLVAYVAGAAALDGATLRAGLATQLPAYLVPTDILVLDALPRTATGKIDRRALPDPLDARSSPSEEDSRYAPRTSMELIVAELWKEALGVDRVSVQDTFIDLGGHSLLAVRVSDRIKRQTRLRINPSGMMLQTLGQFAASLEARRGKPS